MRRIFWTLIALMGGGGTAWAACGGEDLMARLAAERPAAHEAILAGAAGIENGEGRLWRVERAGVPASHLFGTYHDTTAIGTMTAQVEAAFEEAGTLVVELTEDEMARLQARVASDPSFVFAAEGAGVAARLAPAELARAEAVLARRGLTVEMAERMQPWMFFSVMGIPACELEAMAAGAEVMDKALMTRAAAAGMPVVGLETYEEALGAFGGIDPDLAAELAGDALRLAEHEEDIRATMLGLYREGRIAAIDSFSDWLAAEEADRLPAEAVRVGDALEAELIDARNRRWMERLVPVLAAGGAFVAVGGLHLPGDVGLVTLLRGEGFTVARVPE